jgi:uncharacterized protein YjbJ (UPF0337 family)
MNDRLDTLKGKIKATIGALIGSESLELAGVADLARARSRRNAKGNIRLSTASFRESVGQMTANERRATAGRSDPSAPRSGLRRVIAALRS